MDTASELRLQAVNPILADKVRAVDADFQAGTNGDHLEVVQGLRSYAEQLRIWQIGRDENGNVVNPDIVVTHAPPGHSWHEFGLAVDCVPRSLLSIPGWKPDSLLYGVMAAIAQRHGFTRLDCGACWEHKDLPHLELSGRFPISPDDEVRTIYRNGGLLAVWDAAQLA